MQSRPLSGATAMPVSHWDSTAFMCLTLFRMQPTETASVLLEVSLQSLQL